jgi:hypothetical protein
MPNTRGMTDDEFCEAIAERYGAEIEDVIRVKEQTVSELERCGKDPAGFRGIMRTMA